MRLTIIPVDGTVNKDGVSYINLDLSSCNIPSNIHALQWYDTSGWIEFKDTAPNQDITELPAWANCCLTKWDEANIPKPPEPPTAQENKSTAIYLLGATDWTTIPDVGNPAMSNPYLANVNEFVAYRNTVRQYAINPVAGNINWPVMPIEVWTTV
jgi:hypothetical protein